MQVFHHILFSRALAVMTFCMFLVLTPRAWVEPENRGATEEVPVDVLEAPSDCLWCEPAPSAEPCSDSPDNQKQTRRRMWLNPDEPIVVPIDAPCREQTSGPHA